MEELIKLTGVEKFFRRGLSSVKVIENINLTILNKEIVALVGPSGCGKTTLLRLICNVIDPTKGTIQYKGATISSARLAGLIGLVPQSSTLLPNRTVEQNVNLPLEIRHREDKKFLKEILRIVGLSGYESYYPDQLSGGMKQRTALARALVYKPAILLMDEPFASSDEILRESLNEELLNIHRVFHQTIFFVTHDINEAVFLSNRVLVMSASPGRITREIEVSLPVLRNLSIKSENSYFEIVNEVRKSLK